MDAISQHTPGEVAHGTIEIAILQCVAKQQGCAIRYVVNELLPFFSERMVRSSIHHMVLSGYLNEGKPTSDTALRLTSRSQMLLQQPVQ